MASKYLTDDGLDLDSRYLGINATAKAANSVAWLNVTGKPSSLVNSVNGKTGEVKVTGEDIFKPTAAPISISAGTDGSFTVGATGLLQPLTGPRYKTFYINGTNVLFGGQSLAAFYYVKKGWKVNWSNYGYDESTFMLSPTP